MTSTLATTSQRCVRAGGKHDPAESTGIAHYLEHMLFKGSETLGTLDYESEKPHLDRIVELYEQHFAEPDADKRAEIYDAINAESQLAAEYAIATELHAPLNLPVLKYLAKKYGKSQDEIGVWYRHWLARTLAPLEARLAQLGTGDFLFDAPGFFEDQD